MSSWVDYWDTDHPIYVNARHFKAHYDGLARDTLALLDRPGLHVLDYGCGEALNGAVVAAACGHLTLSDAAPTVRGKVAERFKDVANITVASPEEVAMLPDGSFDMILANSLLQYLSSEVLDDLLAQWRRLLKPDGRLVLADVVPPDVSPITDALALLRFGAAHGFFFAAFFGLVRTFFSDYRKIRAELGLSQHREADMLARLERAGYSARRRHPNLGHNQARMTFIATPA